MKMGPFKKLKAPPLANPKGEAELCRGDQQKVPRTPVGGLVRQPRTSDGDIVKKSQTGAPEEIRTPDPQIRRLLRVTDYKTLFLQKGRFAGV